VYSKPSVNAVQPKQLLQQRRQRLRPAKAQQQKRSNALTAVAVQNVTLSLLPAVDKRIDDLQYENYNIPTLKYGERVVIQRESSGYPGVGADAYVLTEADYVDAREVKIYSVPVVTLSTIDDVKQVAKLARLNALLEQLIAGKTVTKAKIKSALTLEQHKDYLYHLENDRDPSEINYSNGMPDELRSYNRKLKAADFQQAKYDKMAGMASTGRAKYKQGTVSRALDKAESLYETALERLKEIWGTASPADVYELQNWMDRDIDFDAGHDSTIGISIDSVPRVRGSKSSHALDSGLPKLSQRLKRQECQLVALREAAWDIAFERVLEDNAQSEADTAALKQRIANLRASKHLWGERD
jgi:hypothetical protein